MIDETPVTNHKTQRKAVSATMLTQLASQLKRLHVANADTMDSSSILFSPKEAQRVSTQSIYAMGRNGIMELIRIDDRFSRFEEQSKSRRSGCKLTGGTLFIYGSLRLLR